MATMLQLLDFLGVAVFAVTGGIVASRLRLDFLAFLFFAVFTGVGGGTLRDLVLGVPIFWVGKSTLNTRKGRPDTSMAARVSASSMARSRLA